MSKIAVFLDRDGVIIEDINDEDKKINILPKVIDGLRLLKKYELILIMVTNQPGIAKGLFTEKEVEITNQRLNNRLKEERCAVDAFYYCPHHPTKGKIKKYSKTCTCRKPKIGMLKQAAEDFKLNLKKCFMVGDFTWDIQAGKKANCTTILVNNRQRNKQEIEEIIKESNPDFYCQNFYQVAEIIVSHL